MSAFREPPALELFWAGPSVRSLDAVMSRRLPGSSYRILIIREATCPCCPNTRYSSDLCWGSYISLGLLVSLHLGGGRRRPWRWGRGPWQARLKGMQVAKEIHVLILKDLGRSLKVHHSVPQVDDHEEKVGHVGMLNIMWWLAIIILFINILLISFVGNSLSDYSRV